MLLNLKILLLPFISQNSSIDAKHHDWEKNFQTVKLTFCQQDSRMSKIQFTVYICCSHFEYFLFGNLELADPEQIAAQSVMDNVAAVQKQFWLCNNNETRRCAQLVVTGDCADRRIWTFIVIFIIQVLFCVKR